ncbi:MAG TPA: YezD family protein [Lacipirellulaceae bacterium]|jgi:hypothetical protein|nr:YezD family protein [Lacipirellulaceae bacterium]
MKTQTAPGSAGGLKRNRANFENNPRQSRRLFAHEGVAVTEPIAHQPHIPIQDRTSAVDETLTQIRDSLRGLRFGSVNIIVQDGVVIQIDRTEKRRLRVDRNKS